MKHETVSHWKATDWWNYYIQLYAHFLEPENAVVKMTFNPETKKFEADRSWFQFAAEAHTTKPPAYAALINHSNINKPIDFAIGRRVYAEEDE
jgi:hypothetical protein